MSERKFESNLNFEKSHKLCRLFLKTTKNGEKYWMGEFNRMFAITAWKRDGYEGGELFVELSLVPKEYKLVEDQKAPANEIDYGKASGDEGIPF